MRPFLYLCRAVLNETRCKDTENSDMNKEKSEKISEISARISKILAEEGLSPNNFAQKLGYSRSQTIYDIINCKSAPSYDFFNRFAISEFSETYNLDWLLTGRGDMKKEKSEKITEISKNSTSVSFDPSIGVPYYDVDFIGGFSEVFNSQTTVPACNIVAPGFEKASVWCNVTGHSMEPKINHGDIVALRQCTVQDIQYGEIYAVVLDSFRTIKILRRGSTPDVLRYVPINPEFDDQEFPISRIINVFEVIGSIAKFF